MKPLWHNRCRRVEASTASVQKGRILRYRKDDAKGWRGGHHLVVSGTRGGKGISAVIPAILDHRGLVVVLDIKGENFAEGMARISRKWPASWS